MNMILRNKLLLYLSITYLMLAFFSCSGRESSIWFDDISYKYILSQEDKQVLGEYIESRIRDKDLPTLSEKLSTDNLPRIVFISVSDGKSRAKVLMGRGDGILEALNRSISKVKEIIKSGYKAQQIKVDIVSETIPEDSRILKKQLLWERSLFGIDFSRETGVALLPEEVVASTIIDSKQKLRKKKLYNYIGIQSDKKELLKEFFKGEKSGLYRFSLISFLLKNGKVSPLYRGHKLFEELTPHQLIDAAIQGGKYLTRSVKANGKFVYLYLPKTSREKNDYNLVRHAGTIFSMLQLFMETKDTSLLEKSRLALNYFNNTIKKLKTPHGTYYCSVGNGYTNLGANALGAIAHLYYYQITKDISYLKTAEQLGNWIEMAQNKSGEFDIQKQYYPGGEVTDFRSQYYPGEALLALTLLYKADGKENWLDLAEKGAKYIIQIRDGSKAKPELEHDHWLLYALNELYRHRPNKLYFDHAMKIASAIINMQRVNAELRDWTGSFYTPPRSTPTATRMEGLTAAYRLTKDYGNAEMQQKIRTALERGIKFQLQTQFEPVSAMYLEYPQRVLGGFKSSLTNYKIRIDYVQHNISSLLGMYHILVEEKITSF